MRKSKRTTTLHVWAEGRQNLYDHTIAAQAVRHYFLIGTADLIHCRKPPPSHRQHCLQTSDHQSLRIRIRAEGGQNQVCRLCNTAAVEGSNLAFHGSMLKCSLALQVLVRHTQMSGNSESSSDWQKSYWQHSSQWWD